VQSWQISPWQDAERSGQEEAWSGSKYLLFVCRTWGVRRPEPRSRAELSGARRNSDRDGHNEGTLREPYGFKRCRKTVRGRRQAVVGEAAPHSPGRIDRSVCTSVACQRGHVLAVHSYECTQCQRGRKQRVSPCTGHHAENRNQLVAASARRGSGHPIARARGAQVAIPRLKAKNARGLFRIVFRAYPILSSHIRSCPRQQKNAHSFPLVPGSGWEFFCVSPKHVKAIDCTITSLTVACNHEATSHKMYVAIRTSLKRKVRQTWYFLYTRFPRPQKKARVCPNKDVRGPFAESSKHTNVLKRLLSRCTSTT
jgi:hypothetical protein